MSAQIIRFSDYAREGRPAAETEPTALDRLIVRTLADEAPALFARTAVPFEDFMRGRRLAEFMIERADQTTIELVFQSLVREAMQRAARGGKRSRTPHTPGSDGFLQGIARFVATGEALKSR